MLFRSGGTVSAEELARDKRHCRRIEHVARQLIAAWVVEPRARILTADVRREAAVITWKFWYADHGVYLRNRMHYVATLGIKTGDNQRPYKSALVRLDNECRWLAYALRD